ncbi:MAG: hypothetical protein DYG94_08495 [Leptolyngbya sp. PLA3]|nr:MAG: hypothetical protein EDM82_07105 [Cyanobacteria bacterium CYA]MCE7968770.1 hypothetical protein [Leptolyngbya sp. PL-A3]
MFTADATDAGFTRTSGDATRIGDPADTADFDAGFVSRPVFADVGLPPGDHRVGVTQRDRIGATRLDR